MAGSKHMKKKIKTTPPATEMFNTSRSGIHASKKKKSKSKKKEDGYCALQFAALDEFVGFIYLQAAWLWNGRDTR